jgi:hypothetical protein
MAEMAFLQTLHEEVDKLQRLFPDLAAGLERATAILVTDGVFPDESGTEAMVRSQSDPTRFHRVNGSCDCEATYFHKGVPCAHRLSWRLYNVVSERLLAVQTDPEERWTISEDAPAHESAPQIPAQFVIMIQDRQFVRFEGLLAMAHENGLVSLETTMVQCSHDLAVCQATAVFQDSRRFTDIGDASPTNVAKHLKPHFPRMAATRASARALRRALNISACSVEELGDEAAA